MIDKTVINIGCETIQTLISYIKDYIDWSNFTPDEQEDVQINLDIAKHFVDKLLEEYK